MARLRKPPVAPGPLRELLTALQDLHARAGWPSTRDLARGQNFSHTVVHELFTAAGVPNLSILLTIVDRMTELAPRVESGETLDTFDQLWTASKQRVTKVPRENALGSILRPGETRLLLLSNQHSELIGEREELRQQRNLEVVEVAAALEQTLSAVRRKGRRRSAPLVAASEDAVRGVLAGRYIADAEFMTAILQLYDASAEQQVRVMRLQGAVTAQYQALELMVVKRDAGEMVSWPTDAFED